MVELEFGKKHKRGKKTLLYIFLSHCWMFILTGSALVYISWSVAYDVLKMPTETFLNAHQNWYISVDMLSQWIFLIGISVVFVGYLKASVDYRYYKFILDKHAVHLHRGLFFIRETTIPYGQISNVHIARPTTYRMFGIAQLDLVTAADRDLDRKDNKTKVFFLPIVDLSIARALSHTLLEYAQKSRNKQRIHIDEDDQFEDEELEDELDDDENIDENTEDLSDDTEETDDDDPTVIISK